jgi:hypothetical protein
MSSEDTRIPVKVDTRQRLRDTGSKGETYDEIIRRLLDEDDAASQRLIEATDVEKNSEGGK